MESRRLGGELNDAVARTADVEQISEAFGIFRYENFPHALSVAHHMILLPATMSTPNMSHP